MTGAAAPTLTEFELPEAETGTPGLRGVLGRPSGDGPWPGVVVVHEAFGVTDVMRRQVERIAAAGYLALMPDLFTEGGARCVMGVFRALRAGRGRAFEDLDRARRVLAEHPESTGRVGVLGFCMGGGFALVAAAGRGFEASSVNYGMLPRGELDDALAGACPIVASYGGRDRSLRGAAGRIESSLARLGVPHDVKEYPAAGHSFLNDAPTGSAATRLLTRRILGAGPEPESAADAWRRIEGFFAEHLGPA